MYYSETKVIMCGLAHVPILIFIVNFVKGKFESIAAKVVEVKAEKPKVKVVEVEKEELKVEELSPELGVTDPVSGNIVSKVGYHD